MIDSLLLAKVYLSAYKNMVSQFGLPTKPMGRTVATWRMRGEERIEGWKQFHRTLRQQERSAYESMINAARNRAAACGMIPTVDPMEPIFLAMLVEAYERISKIEDEIERMRDG